MGTRNLKYSALRHALRNAHELRVDDPVEAFQGGDLGSLRHDPEHARVDVPAAGGDDHVARAFAEFLHRAAGVARVILDVLAELLEYGLVADYNFLANDPHFLAQDENLSSLQIGGKRDASSAPLYRSSAK